ncbi:hypothetical protein GGI25_000452 [Coemansia spiralis]|uniref:DH domain-containing protein n=1 Tax=Coemansia spiralis TaxID=417178 RepID=A0A9W8L0K1_9FUNG|nr:hypothetical protein GGI25_000452 [Coemansia spiralis]
MLVRPRKSKQQRSVGSESLVLDLLEAVAMDPGRDPIYKADQPQQQKQRRKAVQYTQPQLPPYASSQENNNPNTSMNASSAVVTQSIQAAALRSHSHTPNSVQLTQTPSTPPSAQQRPSTQQEYQSIASAPSCSSQALANSSAHRIVDEEQLYLRRVSVLYHELWNSDWVDVSTPEGDPPAKQDSISTPANETPPPTPARPPTIATVGTDDAMRSAATYRNSTWTLLDEAPDHTARLRSSGSTGLSIYDKPLPPLPPSEDAVPTTPVNSDLQEDRKSHENDGDASLLRQRPDTRDSWSSLIGFYTEQGNVTGRTLAVDQLPISKFSPSELADVLVSTVHRLENDTALMQHKRWSVVKELAITEAQYLRDLLLLRTVFYEPLVGASDGGMLRAEDASTIFGNLDQVIDCARSLVEYLTVAVVYESNRCCSNNNDTPHNSALVGSNSEIQPANTEHDRPVNKTSQHNEESMSPSASTPETNRRGANRPASQPEANLMHITAKTSEPRLRNSAWADISIAQAFLLTSQRMERVYAQYCRHFEAATQRLVEIKKLASTSAADATISSIMPPTPVTTYRTPSTSSPFGEHSRGLRHVGIIGNVISVGGGSSKISSNNSGGLLHAVASSDYYDSTDMDYDFTDPDAMYSAFIYQLMKDQARLLTGKTTSWDLPSLLIKPVQRILKYPLLIRNLLALTQPHTSDHGRLERAACIVENIAGTINALNGCDDLRISTATTTSHAFTGNDDSQSRIARELRRVLRRKAGNTNHARSKSSMESVSKDKNKTSSRPKSRAKDNTEHQSNVPGNSSQSSGAEALIEQHEQRISELIRSLRRWESDLGAMLCQQVALVARWKDFYALHEKDNGYSTPIDTNMASTSLASTDDVMLRVSHDTHSRPHSSWQQQQQQQQRNSRSQLAQIYHQNDIRASKSHGLLRDRLPTRPDLGEPRSSAATLNSAGRISLSLTPGTPEGDEGAWWLFKRAAIARYHNALETIYKALYPKALCHPLHSKVYPVLNSLLQVYSDGPRFILSEISRITNPSSSSVFSNNDNSDERASKLRSILANDLPKLFEHEKTVVRLLSELIISIERDFYKQVAELLSSFEFGSEIGWPSKPEQKQEQTSGSTKVVNQANNLVGDKPLSAHASKHRSQHQASNASGWGAQVVEVYNRRFAERNPIGSGVVLPSGTEFISKIQAGLWLLMQETERHGPSQYVVKSRRRQSISAPSDTTDSRSEFSITFDEYSETSVFTPATGSQPIMAMSTPTKGTSTFGVSASVGSPNLGISSDMFAWPHVGLSGMSAHSTSSRAISSKHIRKKSSGFIERFAHLRPGRNGRGSPSIFGNGNNTPPLDAGADQVKSRAQLGLAIDVYNSSSSSLNSSRHRSRSTHCTTTSNALDDKSKGWAANTEKYEPLPLVDSIRFSKGFIDTAFEILGSEDAASGATTNTVSNDLSVDTSESDE